MRSSLDLPSHIVATAPNCVGAMLAGVLMFRDAPDLILLVLLPLSLDEHCPQKMLLRSCLREMDEYIAGAQIKRSTLRHRKTLAMRAAEVGGGKQKVKTYEASQRVSLIHSQLKRSRYTSLWSPVFASLPPTVMPW